MCSSVNGSRLDRNGPASCTTVSKRHLVAAPQNNNLKKVPRRREEHVGVALAVLAAYDHPPVVAFGIDANQLHSLHNQKIRALVTAWSGSNITSITSSRRHAAAPVLPSRSATATTSQPLTLMGS